MAKVGLADTLKLLAAGYKKKDIDTLAAIDEEAEGSVPGNNADINPSAPIITESAPAQAPEAPAPEEDKKITPDLTKQMEELQAKLKESEEKLKKLQKDNINSDSAPNAAEAKKKEQESLVNMVRGFM